MGSFLNLPICLALAAVCQAQAPTGGADDRESLERTTRAIRDGFGRGDVSAVVALHHPDVIKYFGGANVVKGRAALEKGLSAMFKDFEGRIHRQSRREHAVPGRNRCGDEHLPDEGDIEGQREIDDLRRCAMVVYVRYKGSPTGWASIREMASGADGGVNVCLSPRRVGPADATSGRTGGWL